MRFATDCRGRSSGRGLREHCNDQRIRWRDERICMDLEATHMCRQGRMSENVERERGDKGKKEMLVVVSLCGRVVTSPDAHRLRRSNRKQSAVT